MFTGASDLHAYPAALQSLDGVVGVSRSRIGSILCVGASGDVFEPGSCNPFVPIATCRRHAGCTTEYTSTR